MKNILKTILIILLPFVWAGCDDDKEYYNLETPEDTIKMEVSTESVVLTHEHRNDIAVTFNWNEAANRGEGLTVKYYFKLVIADDESNATTIKLDIPEGTTSKSLSQLELSQMMKTLGVTPGVATLLEAEIIAEVTNSDKYMKPVVSKVRFEATSYDIPSRKIFMLWGTDLNSMNPADAEELTATIAEKEFTWDGWMPAGVIKFIEDKEHLVPSYSQGADDQKLFYYQGHDGQTETPFSIPTSGYYKIKMNIEILQIQITAYNPFENVWIVGDAVSTAWDINRSAPLAVDPGNEHILYYEGYLTGGASLKFPLKLQDDWRGPFFVPSVNGTPITDNGGNHTMDYVLIGADNDRTWSVPNDGYYKITMNTSDKTVKFENATDPLLAYKGVWMVGDFNTWGDFVPLYYNAALEGEGVFVWEGDLPQGSFKFPLIGGHTFECDYLMPLNVDGNNEAPLTETSVDFVAHPGVDKKWKVEASEAGTYKIKLDVKNMTISFIKK